MKEIEKKQSCLKEVLKMMNDILEINKVIMGQIELLTQPTVYCNSNKLSSEEMKRILERK